MLSCRAMVMPVGNEPRLVAGEVTAACAVVRDRVGRVSRRSVWADGAPEFEAKMTRMAASEMTVRTMVRVWLAWKEP